MDKKTVAAQLRLAAVKLEAEADRLEASDITVSAHDPVGALDIGGLITFITTILPLIQQILQLLSGFKSNGGGGSGPVAPPQDDPPPFGQ